VAYKKGETYLQQQNNGSFVNMEIYVGGNNICKDKSDFTQDFS